MFGCYLLYSSQGEIKSQIEEREIERSDGQSYLVGKQQGLWNKRNEENLKEY